MGKELLLEAKGFKPYKILIENDFNGLVEACLEVIKPEAKICIITDSNVGPLYADELTRVLLCAYSSVSVYTIEAGEKNKNLDTVSDIYGNLISLNFNRNDCLFALGGGVVGDITGFAAASYMRGIDFVQVPTTLLSQVDSSVGGKTGVDYNSYKNMVGAFYQPRLVYINTNTLKTLPERELSAGLGEVVKYGVIRDNEFFKFMEDNSKAIMALDNEAISHVIYTSCEIKRQVVSEDPTEQGVRAILNFGHTFGHSIEKLKNFELLHGECVSIGMVIAARICVNINEMNDNDLNRIIELLKEFNLPVTYDDLSSDEIISIARHDKKSSAKGIKFILSHGIGDAYIDSTISDEEYKNALNCM